MTATFGAPMPDIALPARKGYVFQGYFNESDGGDMYYTADGSSARDWDGAQDTTLFAQWRPTKYAYKDKRKVKNLTKTGKTVKLYAVWKKK